MELLETALDEESFWPYFPFREREFRQASGALQEGKHMYPVWKEVISKEPHRFSRKYLGPLVLLASMPAYAQAPGGSPWENAVNVLKTAFTGPIATGLSLVAIVVGGLMFAYGEGQSKRVLAGIVFGVGMAIGAVNFMSWLFP
jgi:type IV secretory pathway VirB2 component (pilin)